MKNNEKTIYEKPEMYIMQLDADIVTLSFAGEGDGDNGDFNLFGIDGEGL